jgi:hypothetical protein
VKHYQAQIVCLGSFFSYNLVLRLYSDESCMEVFSSILVPSVQELAKEPLTYVPERYVLPDQDTIVLSNTTSLPQIPVIDLGKLLSQDLNLKGHELEKLHYACKEWGFFQV